MHIGIAGIGNMGSNIGARLMEVGHKLTVWNRTAEKTKPLADAGAAVAKTPAELTSSVEVVISLLIDAAAIDAVYHGPQGLLAGDAKGKLFIEMSTVTPEAQIALAEKVRAKGAAYVECPVSGSVIPARAGKLLGLMGAEPADAARARPLLEQMCRRVMHAGPVGSGALLKLAVNLPLMIYWQALGEQLSHVQDADDRSGGTAGFPRRDLGRRHRAQAAHAGHRCQAEERAVEPTDLQPRRRHQGRQTDARGRREARPRAAAAEADARLLRGGEAHRRRREEVSNVSAYWAGRSKS